MQIKDSKEYIEYLYDCYIYNIFQSEANIIWRQIKYILPYDVDWKKYIDNECVKTYSNNIIGMGKDIINNGMYISFRCSHIGNGLFRIKEGGHRYDGLVKYFKEDKRKENKKFMIIVEDNNINVDEYVNYIVPLEYKYDDCSDIYVNGVVDSKFLIKKLNYNTCLIRYYKKSTEPIRFISLKLSPRIWRWNKRNDDKILAKEILNNMYYHYNNREKYINRYRKMEA